MNSKYGKGMSADPVDSGAYVDATTEKMKSALQKDVKQVKKSAVSQKEQSSTQGAHAPPNTTIQRRRVS